ncbi:MULTISPECIES: hypothetical protein [unclassified Microbacterium]|uniref:hypothetical protein n=1 Tax=unclassified Microbacterium TaxID=2609290 RepID=UPI0012FAD2CD|nr:hypothetical protein [Microbacterium sp. MAH-37]MVQ40675.1 hypothetical protein [Microbacterium sp. MAH-37]
MSDTPQPAPEPPPRSRLGIWAGTGIGCGLHVIAMLLTLTLMSIAMSTGGRALTTTTAGQLIPFIVIAAVSLLLLFPARTRRLGAGMTIVAAASWLVVIGPCFGLYGGY